MSVRSFLPSRKLARNKILARAPGTQVEEATATDAQVKEVTVPEVRVKKMPPDIKVEDIPAEAKAITQQLDEAVAKIRACQDPSFVEHLSELDKVQKLLHKVQCQVDMQTSPVAGALAPLKAATTRLSEAAPEAPWQLGNAVDEVIQAAENLKQRLPGNFFLAEMNEAENNSVQINAPVGWDRSGGRLISQARGNRANNASQVNAFISGSLAEAAEFMRAMQRPH